MKIFPLWPLVAIGLFFALRFTRAFDRWNFSGARKLQESSDATRKKLFFQQTKIKWIKLRFFFHSLVRGGSNKKKNFSIFSLIAMLEKRRRCAFRFLLRFSFSLAVNSEWFLCRLGKLLRRSLALVFSSHWINLLCDQAHRFRWYACKNFLALRLELVSCRIKTARSFSPSLFVDFRASQEVVNYSPGSYNKPSN